MPTLGPRFARLLNDCEWVWRVLGSCSSGREESEAASLMVLAGELGLGGVVERDVAELLEEKVKILDDFVVKVVSFE
jgi:hypothetical protein